MTQSTPHDSSMPPAPDEDSENTDLREQRYRRASLSVFETIVDKQIREARDQGKFDNLRGAGKPITIDKNVYAGDQELAYKLLKDNDFTLPWIADRNAAIDAIDLFRQQIAHQYRLIGPEVEALFRAGRADIARARWTPLLDEWRANLRRVNQQIDMVNLHVPVRRLELMRLTLDGELKRLAVPHALRQ